ncbi:hypothetical protein Glove_139g359 [Diversispora epigaea]|uniref:Protein kinase domain-containing protein n=1 Tax=Diversispora epigaea TaxID=1348612 RepID=A0A397J5K6_9GLOM|nr:hypothetical protein Glove_139g359 [Diversispora epigaea]
MDFFHDFPFHKLTEKNIRKGLLKISTLHTISEPKISYIYGECNQEYDGNCTTQREWIPYNRFKFIKEMTKGGFGTIYVAEWIDGYIIN